MSVNEICDSVAAIIQPDPTLRDDARARPNTYDIDTLYVWPRRESFVAVDTGQMDEQRFELWVAWAAEREDDVEERSRDVSDDIVAQADGMALAVRNNRHVADRFEWIEVADIDYEELYENEVRGYLARITGYYYRTD